MAKLNPKTLKLILDWVGDVPDRQLKDAEYLNSKMVQVFTAASAVMGLAGFSNTVAPGNPPHPSAAATALVALAFLLYLGVALHAFLHLRNQKMAAVRDPDQIWTKLWDATEDQIRHSLIAATAEAFKTNKAVLDGKTDRIQGALFLTGLETALATLALIVARIGF